MANMGIWQLLIIVVIVILLFGTKKLRNFGSDLGSAVKGFKKSMSQDEEKDADFDANNQQKVTDQTQQAQTEKPEVKEKS